MMMNSLELLKIDLKDLVDEETSLAFNLDDTYFAALDGAEVKKGSLHVSVSIRKATGFFELNFHIAGTIKALKTYHGVKQTVLTRCRSLDGK